MVSPTPATAELGRLVIERCEALAALSERPGELTRRFLTPAHRASIELTAGWMREAGMTTRLDAAGTLIGRYEGDGRESRPLLVGSHLDTVCNGGRYDGMLGVVATIACVDQLKRAGRRLAFPIEVPAFGDEEGARFGIALIGSRAMAGTLPAEWLTRRDGDGVSLAEALAGFGLDPARLGEAARRPGDQLGYLELHIEQGPVLEAEDLPLGAVTGICGATRAEVGFAGRSGHAGTVPMAARRDALAGAAEFVLAAEEIARASAGAVLATVGRIGAEPGAANVIAGRCGLTLDVRAPTDPARRAAVARILDTARAIAARRGLEVSIDVFYDADAAPCDAALVADVAACLAARGIVVRSLASGAGHDGMALAAVMPYAMIFMRCAGGISHHPAEAITAEDAAEGTAALLDLLYRLDHRLGRNP